MTQAQDLLDIYRQSPCRTLPNAFWKTGAQADGLQVITRHSSDGSLTALAVWQEERLMAFWCATSADDPLSNREVKETCFALVHEAALSIFAERPFTHREPYFRLVHKGEPPDYDCPPGYQYADVVTEEEISAVVALIRSCYRNIHVDEAIVRSWMTHPTYDPALWVWVREVATGRPVGLGIAEIDKKVPEASIEWVQVLPKEKRKGLGKAITAELLRRVAGKAIFTTVSGQVNNRSRPEYLYRRCGFSGNDIWWLLQVEIESEAH